MTERIAVGKIIGPHGLKGAMRLKSFMDVPESIFSVEQLVTDLGEIVRVKLLHKARDTFIVELSGVVDRTQAENFGKRVLYIHESMLPELSEEEYYLADLIGLKVLDYEENFLGIIENVEDYGGGAFLTIERQGGLGVATLPFRREFVDEIKTESGFIVVRRELLIESSEID